MSVCDGVCCRASPIRCCSVNRISTLSQTAAAPIMACMDTQEYGHRGYRDITLMMRSSSSEAALCVALSFSL